MGMRLDAKTVSKMLKKHFPLHRYAVAMDTTDPTDGTTAASRRIVISEGLPWTSKIVASLIPHDPSLENLVSYHMYMFIATLPFKMRACMFWNMVGASNASGLTPGELLQGEKAADLGRATQQENNLNAKVSSHCKAKPHFFVFHI